MKGDSQRAFTPRLRFPEFRNDFEWRCRDLGDLFEERQETGLSELPLLSVTDKEGVIPQDETRRKSNSSLDKSKYLRVVPGDIAYNTMRMWEGRSAYVALEGVVSPAYTVCKPNASTDSHFFSYYFKTRPLIEQFRRYSQGLVKDTLNLKFEVFAQITVAAPERPEQQQIADCLMSLDEVIAAHGRKLRALQVHKKGLLQQLFVAEGESLPGLRFDDFRDAPQWDEARLEQIVDFSSGGTPAKRDSSFWNGSIPWASAKDMKQLFLDGTEDNITPAAAANGAKQVPAGTVLILTRGMTLLKDIPVCLIRRPMSFNQDVKALRPKDGLNGSFLAYLLLASKQRLLRMVDVAGHGTGRLDTETLKDLDVMLPTPAEQERIADCLTSLENVIAAETDKLNAVRSHRKGLMQQLFPSHDCFVS